MAFELEVMTKARVLDVRTLASKDRKPDEPPGGQLLLQATMPGEALSMFDGFLLGMLFRKGGAGSKQGKLDGMEGMELSGIGEHVKRLPWQYEQTGCTIVIDRGLGGRRSNIELDDCKVHRLSFAPQPGAVKVQWTVDAPGLSDDVRGKLTGLKATDIELTIALPDVQQEEIGDDEPSPSGKASKAKLDAGGRSPFPKGGAKSEKEVRDATGAFLDQHGGAPAH